MEVGHDYVILGGLLALGVLFGTVPLILPLVIGPRGQGAKTTETYECGVDTIGSAWTRFSIAFYMFALIFVAFEVDILYLFPVAVIFGDPALGWRALIETAMFLGILSLAILYAWRKGVFRWK